VSATLALGMVIELTPEQEARIQTVAQRSGRELREVVTDAAVWLSSLEQGYDAALERSIGQADRGEFIDEAEMEARFQRMMQPR
jgi:predicted transcriptional regulator